MSSAPRMMTSHDLRMVSPLSVRDPTRPAGLPIPPLSAHAAVDLESERCGHSGVLMGRGGNVWRRGGLLDQGRVGRWGRAIRAEWKPEHRADANGRGVR